MEGGGAAGALRREMRAGDGLGALASSGAAPQAPPGSALAVCACGEAASVFARGTGRVEVVLPGDGEAVTACCLAPGGATAFVASRSLQVTRYEVAGAKASGAFKAHSAPVLAMACDSSGSLLATAGSDKLAKVWDAKRLYCTHVFREHGGLVLTCVFQPGPELRLATSAADGSVRVWNLRDSSCAFRLDNHSSAVPALAFSARGDFLLSGGRDRVVNVWDARGGELRATVPVNEALEGLACLSVDAGGSVGVGRKRKAQGRAGTPALAGYFATAGEEGCVRVWCAASGRTVAEQRLGRGSEFGEAAAGLLHDSGGDGAREGDRGGAAPQAALCPLSDGQIFKLNFAPDGDVEVLGRMLGDLEQVTDVAFVGRPSGGEGELEQDPLLAVGTNSSDIFLLKNPSREGRVPSKDGLVRTTPECAGVLEGHTDVVLCLSAWGGQLPKISPRPRVQLLASGSKDREARLWEVSVDGNIGGRCLGVARGHFSDVSSLCLVGKAEGSGAALLLATSDSDGFVKTWDLRPVLGGADVAGAADGDGAPALGMLMTVQAHEKEVNCLAASPDGGFLCSGSQDRTARIWELPGVKPKLTLKGHRRGVWSVAFSPVEKVLLTCSGDRSIRLWAIRDGSCLRRLEGHTASVLKATFCSLGTQILSAGADGLLKLWAVRSGECVNTFENHDDKVWALCVGSGDGRFAASGSGDGQLTFWTDATEEVRAEERQAEATLFQQTQEVEDAIRRKDLRRAFKLALRLEHPGRLLKMLKGLLEEHQPDAAAEKVMPLVAGLEEADLGRLAKLAAEWNTNAKHCLEANLVLRAVALTHPIESLRAIPDVRQSAEALEAYTRRHFARMERLRQSTFLIDLALARGGMTALPSGDGAP